MPDRAPAESPVEDAGALARLLRLAVPALPVARPVRLLVAAGCLAVGVAAGRAGAVVAVVVFALVAVPGERRRSRTWWLVPALLRGAEYGFVVAVAATAGPAGGALPAAYGLLAALSFHHYDLVYRIRYARLTPPPWLAVAGGGYEARMLIVALLAVGGEPVLQRGLTVLAGVLAALFVVESVTAWLRLLAVDR